MAGAPLRYSKLSVSNTYTLHRCVLLWGPYELRQQLAVSIAILKDTCGPAVNLTVRELLLAAAEK